MTQLHWSAPDKFHSISLKLLSIFWMIHNKDSESTHKIFTFVHLKKYLNQKNDEKLPICHSRIRLLK